MALDGLFLYCLAGELREKIIGSRLEKIYQPSRQELLLCFRNRTQSAKLLISASGNAPRLHLTDIKYDNPERPPMLTMLLRKNLSGAVLTAIRQHRTDRILFLDFDAVSELGDRVTRTLIVEIMAQYSNIILINEEQKIIDSIKRVDLLQSSVRRILPGLPYALPPAQGKPSLLLDGEDAITPLFTASAQTDAAKALLFSAEGMSPVLCREMTAGLTKQDSAALTQRLEQLRTVITEKKLTPCAVFSPDGQPIDFSFISLKQYEGYPVKAYESLSALLDEFYYEKERVVRAKSKAEDLFRLVSNLIDRTAKKIAGQTAELESAKDRESKKISADLINANLYRLEKGSLYYDLENYYDGMKIMRIAADPRLTPVQNAQKYYKEYRKAATAEKILTQQLEKANDDLEYLHSVQDALSRADTEKEFSAIREELRTAGFIKTGDRKAKQKKTAALPFLEYESPNGFRVLAGRNNLQNDQLTFRTAGKSDIWFHVQKFHGSHVILFTENREPDEKDYLFAADIAVKNSEVRDGGKIPVDYTHVRHVKKPAGAKPGFVIYHVYNTLIL